MINYDYYKNKESLSNVDLTNKKLWARLEQLCEEGHVIGGSVALWLYGIKLNRPFKDIDLIYSGSVKNQNTLISLLLMIQ